MSWFLGIRFIHDLGWNSRISNEIGTMSRLRGMERLDHEAS